MNEFRTDINALRGIAVLLVIAYHFDILGLHGGFVGVDVFFVISGFLMTGIVLQGLQNNAFSFRTFYLARARRIVPALWVMCVSLLIFGAVLLPLPVDYETLAKHVYKAILFLSNHEFAQESGYFAASANEKWVLHTWSLSVEWQFYVLYPVLLWGIWKVIPKIAMLFGVMAVLCVLSFVLSVWMNTYRPEAAFFLLPTRAWEMLVGGLLYGLSGRLVLSLQAARWCQGVGLVGLFVVAWTYHNHLLWPGFWTLLPVVFTVLVVWANQNNRLWRLPGLQWCGTASYSLYLWHWPIWVGLNHYYWQEGWYAKVLGLLATLLVAALSLYGVEQPLRRMLKRWRWQKEMWLWVALVVVVSVGARVIRWGDGFPERLSPKMQQMVAAMNDTNAQEADCQGNEQKMAAACVYGGDKVGLIVVGDSHAQAIIRAAENALPSKDLGVLDWTMVACPPISNINSIDGRSRCAEHMAQLQNMQDQWPAEMPMLLAARWSHYVEGPTEVGQDYERRFPQNMIGTTVYSGRTEAFYQSMQQGIVQTACELQKHRQVYVLAPIPEMPYKVPPYLLKQVWLGQTPELSISQSDYKKRHTKVMQSLQQAAQKCGVKVLQVEKTFCVDGRCYAHDTAGMPLYYDDDHLSLFGSQRLVPLFKTMFEPF